MKDLIDAINANDISKIYKSIRNVLAVENNVLLLRSGEYFRISESRGGLAFDMSGYDSKKPGDCHKYNQYILSLFSDLDLARNMSVMYLDFYKGSGGFSYMYWDDDELEYFDLSGHSTTDIIYRIINICIISNITQRRRRESESLYTLGETKWNIYKYWQWTIHI